MLGNTAKYELNPGPPNGWPSGREDHPERKRIIEALTVLMRRRAPDWNKDNKPNWRPVWNTILENCKSPPAQSLEDVYQQIAGSFPGQATNYSFVTGLGPSEETERNRKLPLVQEREPLGRNARALYKHFITLPEEDAMTGPEIEQWFADPPRKTMLSKSVVSDIIKELEPYGIQNKARIGYYIPRSQRPKSFIVE
jgi:hypothetical protein